MEKNSIDLEEEIDEFTLMFWMMGKVVKGVVSKPILDVGFRNSS